MNIPNIIFENFFNSNVKVLPLLTKTFFSSLELNGYHAIKSFYLFSKGNLKGFDDFYQSVVTFSELGDFIKLPLKTYSEGMISRLLFSMLTSVEYECLALDEIFGVSDANFFEKAQNKIESFLTRIIKYCNWINSRFECWK